MCVCVCIIHSSMNYCECSFTYLIVVLNWVARSNKNYASHCLSTWCISVKKTEFWSVASATQCISCIISGLWVRAPKHWHSLTVSIRLLPTQQLFQSSLNTHLDHRLCSYVYHVFMVITVHTGTTRKLCYRAISFQDFQPMWSLVMIHQHHRWMDGQTDRQTTCDRKTVLYTIVHRTVKN